MKKTLTSAFVFLLVLALAFPPAAYAALTIDEEEYDLYVDEYPEEFSNGVYAKFPKRKSNVEDYYLNLTDANEEFKNALSKTGIDLAENQEVCAFTTTLWYMDPEGEKDDAKKTDASIIYCPLPDDAQEHSKDCKMYSVSSGKVKPVSTAFQTTDEDAVYVKIESYGTYGFVYRNAESYEGEEDDEDDGDGDDNDDEDDDDGDEDDDGDDDDDDEDDDDDDGDEDDDEDDDDDDEDDEDDDDGDEDDGDDEDEDFGDDDSNFYYDDSEYYYEENDNGSQPTATPTPVPVVNSGDSDSGSSVKPETKTDTAKKTESNVSGKSAVSSRSAKDSIPKTGDSFPLEGIIVAISVLTVVFFGSAIVLIFRKKKQYLQ